ncbi:cytosolic carboxypeptidase 2-like isoform X2 [Takifugu rubripes]|uniref:cytosolic carboxypeptidase 2-like isoform X2 n=1 Tax=Takifugu rubripes TaxID=31033 RepID=UPI001145CECC|nr:cytosolic carboxypeptidase 2-like isoform X2 [Takifugu rubripes]
MPAGEEKGKVVYCVDHTTKYPHFTCSRIGGSRGPIRNATFIGEADSTLQFESRFESGNLLKAVQVGLYEYELTLRPDMYTAKHTQWFYFRVRNMKAGANYCFTIVNLMKSSSLYSVGMRPLLYSERAAKETSVGWRRTGSNIRYFRSCNQVKSSDTVTLHSLTWTVQFPYDSDTCYLAHCYPYTYSHLQRYLRGVASNPAITSYCMLRVLCHSLAGNAVYVLTVTSRGSSVVEDKTKRAVVVTARVHPGETNGSWMMEGFLEFLLGESDDARLLRDTFVFKVVPMLNPDGVIVGNYRCSLAGRDLNRNYKTRLRDSFPTVWHTRNMVERLVNETDVVLYCDFHGHNRKNNIFMYGCNSPGDNALKLQERVFPLMMSKNANNKFSFKSCKFRVQKSKEGTGRITMWRLGVKNSYTMEASFGGSTLGDRKGSHFTTRDLKSIGFYFCDTLLDYCDPDPTKIKYCLAELKVLMRKQVREKLGIDVGSGVTVSDVETSTSGSNSSDSNGLPVHLLKQQQSNQTLKKKKKRLRTFKERNRLRPERLRSATQPTALQSNFNSATLQESSSHLDNPERIHPKTGIRCGKNSQVRAGNLHTTQRGDVSQVTLWRGCKPVMNKGSCLEEMKTACRDDRGVESRSRCRCSGQMQHLSAPLPPSAKFIRASQQRQLPSLQRSFTSHKNCRGQAPALIDPHSSPMSLKMIPTKCLLSALTTDKFGMQRRLGDRNTSGVFEHYSLEDSPTIKTKLNDKEQEKDSAGLTESKSHTSLFVPVLRSRPPRAALLVPHDDSMHLKNPQYFAF